MRALFAALALLCGTAQAAPITFAWDADAQYPAGVTYEFQANGIGSSDIAATQYTLDVPGNPGDPLHAQVRAIPPVGYQCGNPPSECQPSDWAVLDTVIPAPVLYTQPADPIHLSVTRSEITGMPAPSYIDINQTAWNAVPSAGGVLTTGSHAVNANDVLVACAVQENGLIAFPGTIFSGGSLTWTTRQSYRANSNDIKLALGTATVDTNKSMTESADTDSTDRVAGLGVLRFSGSDGIGASAQNNGASGNPTVNITTTQANSALVVVWGDWNAITAGTPSYGGGTGTGVVDYADGATYGAYIAYYADAGAAGAKTVTVTGITNPKWAIAVVEIKGSASAPAFVPYRSVYPVLLAQ